jgi:polysaccharide biosynthesis transport protein
MPNHLSPYFIERTAPNGSTYAHPFKLDAAYEETGVGLAEFWNTIKRRRGLIGYVVSAALILTAAVVFLMQPQYQAVATLQIDPEPPHLMDVTKLLQQLRNQDEDDYKKTQYSLLQNDQLEAQVIVDLGLERNPLFNKHVVPNDYVGIVRFFIRSWKEHLLPSRERRGRFGVSPYAIDVYHSRLRVAPDGGTRLVLVSFDSPDPALSAQIVNTHVRDYLMLNRHLQEQGGEAARAFLEKQLFELRARVEHSEAALNSYRSKVGILSFGIHDQAKNEIAEQTMVELNRGLAEATAQRIKAESEMELVKAGDYGSLPAVVSNLMIQNLKPEVDRLQAQTGELESRYTDEYPTLVEAKAKLREQRARLTNEIAAIAHATERSYNSALLREQHLQQKIDAEKKVDFSLNDASLQDAVLAREVDTNRQVYRDVMKRMQEISVSGAAPIANIALVEDAVLPSAPSSPQKVRDLVVSGILSLFVALGLICIGEQMDDRLKSGEEIESYLHLPELAVVPDFSGLLSEKGTIQKFLSAPRSEDRLSGVLSLVSKGKDSSEGAVPPIVSGPRAGNVMEAFRSIRTALLYSRAGGAPRSVLFVSAVPGEGKTMTTCGTAWAFAQTGARTLLIDADLREPRCHKNLNARRSMGLSEVLAGLAEPDQVIQRLDRRRFHIQQDLYFLGAGAQVPNPGELLTSTKMFEVLRYLRDQYQFVLLDSAPVRFASDTIGLATMVDSVVVVAGAATSKQTVRAACRKLSDAGASIAGVVANWADIGRVPDEASSYYRSGYYSEPSTEPETATESETTDVTAKPSFDSQ